MTATLVLFDIDGTLISSGGAGRRAMDLALQSQGCAGSSFSMAGMTDRAIARRALLAGGCPAHEGAIDAVLVRYLAVLAESLGEQVLVLQGVRELLTRLAGLAQLRLGLGTGNLAAGAQLKLAGTGLWPYFEFGGFGCDAEERAKLLRIAAERGAVQAGLPLAECRVCVVGDTIHDIVSARANGFACLAVATGGNSRDALATEQPQLLVDSLLDPRALQWLAADSGSLT